MPPASSYTSGHGVGHQISSRNWVSSLLPKLIKPTSVWLQPSVLAAHHCSLLPQVAFFFLAIVVQVQGLGFRVTIIHISEEFFLAVVNFRLSVMPTPISSTRSYTAMICITTSQTRTYTQTRLLQLKMEHCMSFLFMLQMSSYHHMDAISVLLTCARYDYNCKKAEAEEAHIIEERRVTECLILQ